MFAPQIGWQYIHAFAVFGNGAARYFQTLSGKFLLNSCIRERFTRIFVGDQLPDKLFNSAAGNIFAGSIFVAAGKEETVLFNALRGIQVLVGDRAADSSFVQIKLLRNFCHGHRLQISYAMAEKIRLSDGNNVGYPCKGILPQFQ